MKEVEKYQKSDHYKKYLQTVAALQQRQQRKKVEKEQKKKKKLSSSKQPPQGEETAPAEPATESPSLPPPSRPPPLSLKQSFVAGTEIPVFTNLFLLHNRELEVQVRKLRQTTTDLEEECALISRHVDNMKRQTVRLESDVQNQILKNQILKKRLVFLQETISDTFGSLSIPGIHSVPSVDTIQEYLKEVESVVAKQPAGEDKQFDEVFFTVRRVAKETMERVREREEGEQENNTMDTTN
ncbi:High mobility group protein 20A [Geodia barretti]|nr:High mobility group protein 20A [Geodia barretti]